MLKLKVDLCSEKVESYISQEAFEQAWGEHAEHATPLSLQAKGSCCSNNALCTTEVWNTCSKSNNFRLLQIINSDRAD